MHGSCTRATTLASGQAATGPSSEYILPQAGGAAQLAPALGLDAAPVRTLVRTVERTHVVFCYGTGVQ